MRDSTSASDCQFIHCRNTSVSVEAMNVMPTSSASVPTAITPRSALRWRSLHDSCQFTLGRMSCHPLRRCRSPRIDSIST